LLKKQSTIGKSSEHPAPPDVSQSPLIEGEDYYFERDLMVFTAGFLRRRGYCCDSGCRHCPYAQEKEVTE
jgi:hypothetical protein